MNGGIFCEKKCMAGRWISIRIRCFGVLFLLLLRTSKAFYIYLRFIERDFSFRNARKLSPKRKKKQG